MRDRETASIDILLIEDNPGDARLIAEALHGAAGVTLEQVDRLAVAVARLKRAPVHVVLLDLALPDGHGHETFAAVRAVAPHAAIIVLTAMGDESLAIRLVQEGAQDYLVKGQADGAALWRAIRYAIERQAARLALVVSERRWQAIIHTALDAVITMDAAGVICDWNPSAERMFGWPTADVLGRSLADTIIPRDQRAAHERGQANLLAAADGRMLGTRTELTALHRDGHVFPVEIAVTPITLDAGWVFCAFLRDISDRQQAERDIKQLNEALEQRVAERTAALEAANRDLEVFTYSVSHDLRAPLRHVSSFVRILVDEFRDTLAPQAQHYLTRIEDGARHMGHLVDDLLALARVGKRELQMRPTPLAPIVERIINGLKADTVGRSIAWRVADLPVVVCDAGLIEVLLTNLLSNAVKYTRPRPHARIAVGQTTRDGMPVVFVRDNGVGFEMKYAGKVFGVFQRLHPPEDFEGTGVGLATVHRIASRHGWTVWADALVNKGATFFFTIGAPEGGAAIRPLPAPAHEVA